MMQQTLREARERKGWSLAQLARKAGMHKSTISRLENGVVQPLHATALALERALGLKPGQLIFQKGTR